MNWIFESYASAYGVACGLVRNPGRTGRRDRQRPAVLGVGAAQGKVTDV